MAPRPKFGPLTPPPLSGAAFLAEYKAGMKGLFDAAVFPLTGIGGTANSVTASLAWDIDAGLLDGMKFTLTWAADNTGPMTLAINGAAPVNVLDASGGAMIAGAAKGGTRALIEYIAGAFRVLTGGGVSAADQHFDWLFTSSGTWTKPAGLSDDTLVLVEVLGGGGGGGTSNTSPNNNGSGGGGAYASAWFRLGDLPSSVSVAVGAGGTPGSAGGNSTFGLFLTGYGGGAGGNSNASFRGGHGGGGGLLSAGLNGGSAGGGGAGGDGGGGLMGGGSNTNTTAHALLAEGGGGGNGGRAYRGGGGGGGGGGSSVFAGDGGSGLDQPGAAPSGGGGGRAAGARGQVRIRI